MKAIKFKPAGPLNVPLSMSTGLIYRANVGAEYWEQKETRIFKDKVGCYVFAVPRKRDQEGYLPVYVGMTLRGFCQECFHDGNLQKLNEYLGHHGTETLVLMLLVHPPRQHGPNKKAISDLQAELIRMARDANRDLVNRQLVKPYSWGIQGVIRGGHGMPNAAHVIAEMFRFAERGVPEKREDHEVAADELHKQTDPLRPVKTQNSLFEESEGRRQERESEKQDEAEQKSEPISPAKTKTSTLT